MSDWLGGQSTELDGLKGVEDPVCGAGPVAVPVSAPTGQLSDHPPVPAASVAQFGVAGSPPKNLPKMLEIVTTVVQVLYDVPGPGLLGPLLSSVMTIALLRSQ